MVLHLFWKQRSLHSQSWLSICYTVTRTVSWATIPFILPEDIHKIFYIIQQLYKEELCARLWVKGFKAKVDQDKSRLYLKRARSQVLTNPWPQEAGDMILGLGGHVEHWATQALPLGIAFPPLHPCWKAGQSTMFSRESEVWIFMYNLLILMLATNFFPQKHWEWNLHSDVLESAFSLCRFLFLA